MLRKQNDSVLIGFMIGVTVPVLGYWVIENIFAILTDQGIMDATTISTIGKRSKTLALLGICCNIIPSQYASSRRYVSVMKGIILATLIYAACWAAHFYFGIGI